LNYFNNLADERRLYSVYTTVMCFLIAVLMLQLLQQIAKPHVDSFNYMLSTGLSDAIKVCFCLLLFCCFPLAWNSLQYFTDSTERESRPFREEPETHLYFNALSSAPWDPSWFLHTQHFWHVHNHNWSGVFNLLKFDHTPKKKFA